MSAWAFPNIYDLVCEIAFTRPFVAPTWTDVSTRLISFESSRGQQYDYDGPQPGSLTVVLDSTDGAFDPENTSSPYYPNVRINRQFRIRAQRSFGSPVVYLAHGYADSWERSWPGGMRVSETTVTCTDLTKYFNRWTNSISQAAASASVHMAAISGATTPAPAGGLAVAATTYAGNQWDNITNLAIADGGLFYIDGNNVPTYQSSAYRTSGTRSATSQATYAFGLSSGTEIESPVPRLDDRLLANMITVVDAAGTPHTANHAGSQGEYGDLPFSITTNLTASAADTRAAAIRSYRAIPQPRIESLTIDALTGAQQATDALALLMGDRITLVTQPLGGGASVSRDYWIHGVNHNVNAGQWLTSYNVVSTY